MPIMVDGNNVLHALRPSIHRRSELRRLTLELARREGVQIILVFDGPTNAGLVPPDEVVALGVSETSATGSGLDILSIPDGDLPPLEIIDDGLGLELGVSSLLDQSSVSPSMPIAGQPASASSNWTVENQSADDLDDLIADLYLVIVTELPFMGEDVSGNPFTVDYDPADVGLDLRSEEGWVIVKSFSASLGTDLFFPAISLGSVLAGDSASFLMRYELAAAKTAVVGPDPGGIELQLPKLQVYGTFLPIPEPSTRF